MAYNNLVDDTHELCKNLKNSNKLQKTKTCFKTKEQLLIVFVLASKISFEMIHLASFTPSESIENAN
jgi:hypothetical protein